MFKNILIVCTGNICRSPIAQALLNNQLPNHHIQSAGIAVTHNQLERVPAHPYSIEVCAEHNIDISQHFAQQLCPALCAECDLILVMSYEQIDEVAQISPMARGKTMLFGHWIGQGEISDPVYQPKIEFVRLFDTLTRAAQAWAQKLSD